jgi:hypothetical protein
MIATRHAPGNLQINDAVADPIARDHFLEDHSERARGYRHADLQFAKGALESFKVAPLVNQPTAPHLANFINPVGKLVAAILDVNFGVVERQITAIDVGNAGHGFQVSGFGNQGIRKLPAGVVFDT